MSVLIKGMEMPKSCFECKLDLRTDICRTFCEWKAEHPYSIRRKDRLPDCPLAEVPEKHGRLIDANKLKLEYPHDSDWDYPVNTNCYVSESIDNAPTVIEQEGE